MKFETFVKKVESHLGVKVEEGYNGKYWFQYGNSVGSFRKEEQWDKPGHFVARGFHSRHEDDHTDLMTDYFAGSYYDNGTQLLHSFKAPEPKFPVGTLVRGKQNKRAIRQGYAGKTGLVTKAGGYMSIDWLGEEKPRYAMTYPERDIELVSAA